MFAQHFCNRLGPAYLQLKNVLNENDLAHAEVLNDIKRRFREETFTRESIAQVFHAHPDLVWLSSLCLMYLWEANYRLLQIGSVVVCELRDDALSFYRK